MRRLCILVLVGVSVSSAHGVDYSDPAPSFMPPPHPVPLLDLSIHKRLFTNCTYSDLEFLGKCQPCHGGSTMQNSTGSEYSKTSALRRLGKFVVTKDTPIGCSLCHST